MELSVKSCGPVKRNAGPGMNRCRGKGSNEYRAELNQRGASDDIRAASRWVAWTRQLRFGKDSDHGCKHSAWTP